MARVVILYRRSLIIFILVVLGISVWGIEYIYADSIWKSRMYEPGIKDKIIIIDPGHGGADPGALYGDLLEKDINLDISQKLAAQFKNNGIDAYLTRGKNGGLNPDKIMSRNERRINLNKRKNFGQDKKGNVFVSIHTNSFNDPSVSGIAIFYEKNNGYSKSLALSVAEKIEGQFGERVVVQQANYLVIKDNPIPSVLVEVGFISNYNDRTKLADDKYRSTLASCIAKGIEQYTSRLGMVVQK